MYEHGIKYKRTPQEMTDKQASWDRPNKAFFAAGACHILAYAYKQLHSERNLQIIFIKPIEQFGDNGTHVYVVEGDMAFDFNGWTKESELLETTEQVCQAAYPGWKYQRLVVDDDIETFCQQHNHQLPKDFAGDSWARAQAYIKSLEVV